MDQKKEASVIIPPNDEQGTVASSVVNMHMLQI